MVDKMRGALLFLVVSAGSALAGFGAIYATLAPGDNPREPAAPRPMLVAGTTQAQSAELPKGPGSNALSQGQMAGFVWKKEPEALPDIAFVDGTGAQRTLADWKGRTVLLNLWATWCAPCRKEMPALDHLQAALGSDKFEVVALSVDRAGPEAAKRFLDQIAVQKLGLYVDKTARSSSALKVIGMPTTLLIDANGRELGRLVGPAEWDSDDAKRLIRAAMGTP